MNDIAKLFRLIILAIDFMVDNQPIKKALDETRA